MTEWEAQIKTSPYATVKYEQRACVDEDAAKINKAYRGIGCNKLIIAEILTHRAWFQREKIVEKYKKNFNEDLIKRTKSELSLPFERLIVLLLYTGYDMDAYMLFKATKGLGTDESALWFVLCSKSSNDINSIKQRYFCLFKKNLTDEIKDDTSGLFRDILVNLCDNKRETCQIIDKTVILKDIDFLSEFSCSKIDKIIEIFCHKSFAYIQCLCKIYEQIHKKDLGINLSQYYDTDFGQFAVDPIKFYCGILREGIESKNIYKVMRLIVTRCEILYCKGNVITKFFKGFQIISDTCNEQYVEIEHW
ncbi:hypothetical protein HZS_2125 [Henneguya salminicola]|nr:hypothetical protein HZS_2125 [Henneguya salminicola]